MTAVNRIRHLSVLVGLSLLLAFLPAVLPSVAPNLAPSAEAAHDPGGFKATLITDLEVSTDPIDGREIVTWKAGRHLDGHVGNINDLGVDPRDLIGIHVYDHTAVAVYSGPNFEGFCETLHQEGYFTFANRTVDRPVSFLFGHTCLGPVKDKPIVTGLQIADGGFPGFDVKCGSSYSRSIHSMNEGHNGHHLFLCVQYGPDTRIGFSNFDSTEPYWNPNNPAEPGVKSDDCPDNGRHRVLNSFDDQISTNRGNFRYPHLYLCSVRQDPSRPSLPLRDAAISIDGARCTTLLGLSSNVNVHRGSYNLSDNGPEHLPFIKPTAHLCTSYQRSHRNYAVVGETRKPLINVGAVQVRAPDCEGPFPQPCDADNEVLPSGEWNTTGRPVVVPYQCRRFVGDSTITTSHGTVFDRQGRFFAQAVCEDDWGNQSTEEVEVRSDSEPLHMWMSFQEEVGPLEWEQRDWYSWPVTVTFYCEDFRSGIESCPDPVVFGEGAEQSVTVTARNNAGIERTETVEGINVDLSPPTVTVTLDPPPNEAGWHNDEMWVRYSCADPLSGVLECPEDEMVWTQGSPIVLDRSAWDHAGHGRLIRVVVRMDRTDPWVNHAIVDEAGEPIVPNDAGWFSVPVDVRIWCEDDLSGIESCTPGGLLGEGRNRIDATAVDRAGNTASEVIEVDIDWTPPTVTLSGPTEVPIDEQVVITCDAHDELSGLREATCPGLDVPAGELGLGRHTHVADVLDNAGNATTAEHTFEVVEAERRPPWPERAVQQLTRVVNEVLRVIPKIFRSLRW